MNTNLVVVILGGLAILGALVLLWRVQSQKGNGNFEVSLAKIFTLKQIGRAHV